MIENSISFRIDRNSIDPVTGRYTENTDLARINRASPSYLKGSIQRLEIIADCRLQSKQDICAALKQYGYALLDVQREALEAYCWTSN